MKNINLSINYKSALAAVMITAFLWGCAKPLTQQDVEDDLQDAREATQEAKEKTQQAFDARQQFYTDYKETKIKELEDRVNDIDNRISELNKTARKSSNRQAEADMGSAIDELEQEKNEVNDQISDVRSIREEDWSASYQAINESIAIIEEELEKLSNSLQSNN